MRLKALLLTTAIVLAGCAGQWTRVDGEQVTHTAESYQVTLPQGWVKVSFGDVLIVTRDGPGLQRIIIRSTNLDKAFDRLEKPATKGQLPSELAELYLANLRKEDPDGIPSLKILSNEPATVAGNDAYRVHFSYQTADGLAYQSIVYGFIAGDKFDTVSYTAPTLHYFDRDAGSIDQVIAAFQPR